MRHTQMIVLLALAACVRPEEGIDRDVITGTVRLLPTEVVAEQANDDEGTAQDLGDLRYGWTVITGDIDRYGATDDGLARSADKEWFLFTVGKEAEATVRIRVGDAPAPQLPMPDTDAPSDTDTGLPADTDTGLPADTDTGLPADTDAPTDTGDTDGPPGPTLRIEILDLAVRDEEGKPTAIAALDATAGDWELPVGLAAGGAYALRVGGLYGEEGVALAYRFELQALHPDLAAIKVGAYTSADPFERGAPVAGATVQPFVLQEDLSYEAAYQMLGGVRSVTSVDPTPTDADPTTDNTVVEGLSEVWIFAGDWANLNAGIRAGTWYTSAPAHLELPAARAEHEAEPVLLDTFAAALVGQTAIDTEPNDVDVELADTTQAQDLGVISELGYVDVVTGSITFTSLDADWVHDIDAYRFAVPIASQLFFTLDWPGADVDLDVVILDSEANLLDAGYYGHPEVNEYGFEEALQPEQEYFLLVLGYLGDPAVETTYDLRMELAPF